MDPFNSVNKIVCTIRNCILRKSREQVGSRCMEFWGSCQEHFVCSIIFLPWHFTVDIFSIIPPLFLPSWVMYDMVPVLFHFQRTFYFAMPESISIIMGLYFYYCQREHRSDNKYIYKSQIPEWTKWGENNVPKLSMVPSVSSLIITRLIWGLFLKPSYFLSMQWLMIVGNKEVQYCCHDFEWYDF